ncbi:MAG: nitrogenase component 1 [Oscillospiraceae bacterium]|nr:nitrogenase component 1 [Oscillospiraceae bacterium]
MSKYSSELTYGQAAVFNPPPRETRIPSCAVYCGTCGQLSEDVTAGCANVQSRKFSQSGGCQLSLAVGILSTLANVAVIIHSPLGCCSNLSGMGALRAAARAAKGKPADDFVWLHTNLTELDVVNGGIDKLKRAILYTEKEYHPEAIIIANGCVPGIIGDDIDALVAELDGTLGAILVPVHCEGFKSRFVPSGYDSAYHGLLRHLVEPRERYERVFPDYARDELERYNDSITVNIYNVGSNSSGDETELARLVSALGLIPKVLPLHAGLDDLADIGRAALNVSICATHDDYLLGHLKERFGTPYIIDTFPIGITGTNQWLRKIAEHFHLEAEAERLIAVETKELVEALIPLRAELQGKSIFVGGGETRVLATAEFFWETLGMNLVGVKPHHADRFIEEMLTDLLPRNLELIVAAGQPAEEINVLNKLKPDLYIGHTGSNGWVTKLGIPNFPLFGQSFNYMGYSGAWELARKAVKILKNPSFTRNIAANLSLPLSREWLEADVSSNIKQTEAL